MYCANGQVSSVNVSSPLMKTYWNIGCFSKAVQGIAFVENDKDTEAIYVHMNSLLV